MQQHPPPFAVAIRLRRVCLLACMWLAAFGPLGVRADDDADEGEERLQSWIQATEETLDRGHEPHLDLRRGPLGVPRTRAATGTAWLPTQSPSYSLLFPVRRWGMLVRGNIFLGYGISQSDGRTQAATNVSTFLLAAIGSLGPGELVLRSVLSLEGLTRSRGAPAPFWQRADGRPDRQPTHTLFHELAAQLTWPLSRHVAVQGYAAWPGSPALGPPDYTFRPSAFFDPIAPLTTPLLEGTRSSPGVLTLGLVGKEIKLEGSWFSAPDVHVPDSGLRVGPLDSGSVRASFAPSPRLVMSLSYGHVRRPLSRRLQHRTIVSTLWTHHRAKDDWSVAVIGGVGLSNDAPTDAGALVEATWQADRGHTVFTRLQAMQQATPSSISAYIARPAERTLSTLSMGYVYSFHNFEGLAPGLGFRVEGGVGASTVGPTTTGPWAAGASMFVQLRQSSLPGPRPH